MAPGIRVLWPLWAGWAVTTLLVSMISELVGTAIAVDSISHLADPNHGLCCDNALGPLLLWSVGVFGTLAALLGFAQGWVLRRDILGAAWKDWAWVNLLGLVLAIGGYLGTTFMLPESWLGLGLGLPGFMLGFAQWLILRRTLAPAGWWILGSGGAWILGAWAGNGLTTAWLPGPDAYDFPFYPAAGVLHWVIGWAIGSGVFALLTGILLSWLVGRPRPLRGEDTSAADTSPTESLPETPLGAAAGGGSGHPGG